MYETSNLRDWSTKQRPPAPAQQPVPRPHSTRWRFARHSCATVSLKQTKFPLKYTLPLKLSLQKYPCNLYEMCGVHES